LIIEKIFYNTLSRSLPRLSARSLNVLFMMQEVTMGRGANMSYGRFLQVGTAVHRRVCALLAACLLFLGTTLSLAVAAPAVTQAPTGSAHVKSSLRQDAIFTHITVEQGLSDQRVQAIMQDSVGFIWFGTNNGLNRYDGYDVVAYRHDPTNPHSLSGNFVEDLYEDRSGTLWVSTRSGLNAFDRRTERFTRYRHDPADPHSLSDNTVIAIYEDRSGVLWLGTAGGLNRFDRTTETFTAYQHDSANPRSLSHNTVRVIYEDRSGALWLGTLNGLNRFDRTTETFTAYQHDPANPRSLSHNVVWDIYEDRAGMLWLGTDGGGLNRFDPATGAFTHYRHDPDNPHSLSEDRVDSLLGDASGALWIATFGGGLSVLDAARQTFMTYRHDSTIPASLSNDYVADITADRFGLIWIGTHGSGVDVYSPQRQSFTIYRHDPKAATSLASDNVWTVYEDQDGALWIGTQDRGLDRFDRRSGQVVHYPPDPENPQRLGHPWVAALQQDQTGALWIGTYGGGLYRLDPVRSSFTAYRHDPANPRSLSHNTIVDLHIDRFGALWVATRGGGLNRLDPDSSAFTAYRHDPANPQSLSSDWVWAIDEDQRGSIWIGTLGGGLNRLEPATGQITRYQHDPQNHASLSDDSIWTLHIDRAGVVWVGTFGGGLDRFDPASGIFTHYRERDGLASDRIVALLEDGDAADPAAGNLWIATGRGLSKLDRDHKAFHTYNTTDGLPLTEYNRGGCRTRSGELLMSSIHGLIAFNPAAVRDDADVSPLVFTNFLLANKPVTIGETSPLRQAIDQTDTIELTYADRVISFEFAALSYRAPQQSRYRYKLEGFDDDWTEVGSKQRLVTYTNLDPGRYVFRVTAANARGVWNGTGRAIALVITPPWWATWWFRGLALALIVGCAFSVYAWRVNSLKGQQRALEAEIAERKQAEEALRASQDSLRRSNAQIQDLAGRLITAQEAERTRIARELHDDISQQLAALSIACSGFKRRLPSEAVALQQEVAHLQQQTITLAEAIRRLSHELHPGVLKHAGLVRTLQGICAEFGSQHGIGVAFHADTGLEGIPEDVALCLYRVAQEALHNIARHAEVRQAEVTLTRSEGILELRVADDGQGFDLAAARQRGGLGLISIDERVRLVQGCVRIVTEPRRGTELRVRVPSHAGEETPLEEENALRKSAVG
jgi:signal transduction histidine kinase/ligand-binding sensor domain-containing protein